MNAAKKLPFGKLPLLAISTFEYHTPSRFEEEWRKDSTAITRRFKRSVRAGGASKLLTVVVVRRKPEAGQ